MGHEYPGEGGGGGYPLWKRSGREASSGVRSLRGLTLAKEVMGEGEGLGHFSAGLVEVSGESPSSKLV